MMLVGFGVPRLPASLIKAFIVWAVVLNCYAFALQILA
jgi:hypothetical protein